MQPTQFTDAVEAISSEHQGYDSGAYYFLKDTLDFTVRRVMESNDGKHRSHRFIAANQAIPWLNKDEEQMKLTEEWLRGHSTIPEIAHKWTRGPAVPIMIELLDPKRAGTLRWRVVVTNNKVGHNFPRHSRSFCPQFFTRETTFP